MKPRRIAFIGAGNMGTALIRGLLGAGSCPRELIGASDPDPARLRALSAEFGIATSADNAAAVESSEVVFLAVKPQVLPGLLQKLRPNIPPSKLVVSIAAGVSCAAIEAELGADARIVRAMPNTPALVLAGATGVAKGRNATDEDLGWAKELFEVVGQAVVVDEKLLDVVTGLSGSGPAYVMLFIEALADGAVKMGLPKPLALELATATVLGAAKLLRESGEHPAKLRDQVTSPGGTTIAGIAALEAGRARATIMEAVEAATLRAEELGGRSRK